MGEPPDQPPAMPERQRPVHRLKYVLKHVLLIIVFLSGPVMFSLAAAKSFATEDVNSCQDTTRDTPWDWADAKLRLTFDENESQKGDGWIRVIGDRDALEMAAFTVDKQKIRLHSASWPVQPKAGSELFFWSPDEVAKYVEQSRDEADKDEDWKSKLRRDLHRAQWIARDSVWHWDHPDGKEVLDALSSKNDEAAARQLAIWRVLDGLNPKSYSSSGLTETISRRAQELVELAAYYAEENGERDLATASVGAWAARKAGQVLVKADIRLSSGDEVPNEPLTFDFPGGRVLARTNEHGEVCMSLPDTIGETPPTVVVRWERYVRAGSYFGGLNSGIAAKGAEEHMDRTRALAGRPFVGITLNGYRAIDELTLPIPPNE
jgi:hypothetical protein